MKQVILLLTLFSLTAPLLADGLDDYREDTESLYRTGAGSEDGTFTTMLPKSQTSVKLKPMTYGEIMEVQKMVESYPQGRTAPKVTWRLSKQIVDINGSTDKGEVVKFIEQMPISDSKFLKKFMDENEPKLDMKKIISKYL